jgi:Tol biopolymer transport system component
MSKVGLFFFILLSCWVIPASAEWSDPVNLGPNINTSWFEYYPSISADDTMLYFTAADRPGGFGGDDIWISTWGGSDWGIPVNAGSNVNSNNAEISPSISTDGTKLYFSSWRSVDAWDIWVSTWEDTMWSPALNLGPNVNTSFMEWNVNISYDGKKLYFASDRPGSFGDDDLWVSEWDSLGNEWGTATNLGPNVNTFNREYSPSISSDGSKLYFARWLGFNHPDIFVSDWQDTIWGPAVNLGSPVNTPTWDDGPSISNDGMRLYFASSRDTNNPAIQDIWYSDWVTGVEEEDRDQGSGIRGQLLQSQPNPSLSSVLIGYSLKVSGDISLNVYDITGKLVRTLVNKKKEKGNYEIIWDGKNEDGVEVRSGIYFYRLTTGKSRQTRKMVLIH